MKVAGGDEKGKEIEEQNIQKKKGRGRRGGGGRRGGTGGRGEVMVVQREKNHIPITFYY